MGLADGVAWERDYGAPERRTVAGQQSGVSAIDAIEKAMEGVTPGPWHSAGGYLTTRNPESASFRNSIYHLDEFGQEAPHSPFQAIPFSRAQDAAYLATCSPGRMREVLAAAREAEALKREISELREVLLPFAAVANVYDGTAVEDADPVLSTDGPRITAGDLRRARALLGKQSDDAAGSALKSKGSGVANE